MTKETIIRGISILLALTGLLILWQSTVWGLKAFPEIVQQLGAIPGDIQLQNATRGPVTTLQIIGAVLLGVGLFRALEPHQRP